MSKFAERRSLEDIIQMHDSLTAALGYVRQAIDGMQELGMDALLMQDAEMWHRFGPGTRKWCLKVLSSFEEQKDPFLQERARRKAGKKK